MIRIVTMSLLVLASVALADDYEQRSKLMGSWQIETTGSQGGVVVDLATVA